MGSQANLVPFENKRALILQAENNDLRRALKEAAEGMNALTEILKLQQQNTFRLNAVLISRMGGTVTLKLEEFATFNPLTIIEQSTDPKSGDLTLSVKIVTPDEAIQLKAEAEGGKPPSRGPQLILPNGMEH